MYDENGKIGGKSRNLLQRQTVRNSKDSIVFSSLIQIGTKRYFGIRVPLYNIDKTQIKGRCGECLILINMSYLDEILEGRLPTSDSSFVLKGEDGQIMVQQGVEFLFN